jgi:hypothetical protein
MNKVFVGFLILLIAVPLSGPAAAWGHANRWGGSTSHSFGSGSTTRTTGWGGSETHTYGQGTTASGRYGGTASHEQGSGSTSFDNAYGGSATHTYGEGTTATNRYGDTATHKEGTDYTTASNPYGGTATHTYGEGTTATTSYGATVYHKPYYGATYPAYHPPATVNYYGSDCHDCGGWSTGGAAVAGAVVGLAAGAAIASDKNSAATTSAYNAGVAACTTDATAAYDAGVATATTATVTGTTAAAQTTYAMGSIHATLPAGSMSIDKGGTTYYLHGNTWFQPAHGANGVYYRVVAAP